MAGSGVAECSRGEGTGSGCAVEGAGIVGTLRALLLELGLEERAGDVSEAGASDRLGPGPERGSGSFGSETGGERAGAELEVDRSVPGRRVRKLEPGPSLEGGA